MEELIRGRVKDISTNYYKEFFKKPNVIGIGFGHKEIKGLSTKIPCIKVLVTKKIKTDDLGSYNLIDQIYNEIPTDVIEVGSIQRASSHFLEDPMSFGDSIGPAFEEYVGTSGCLVKDSDGYYILSNNHVLANNNELPMGSPIICPGTADGGAYPEDLIANLTRFIPVKFSSGEEDETFNIVDCAIAKIIDIAYVNRYIWKIGCVNGVGDAKLGECVKKVGRTSDLTTGIVNVLDATVEVKAGENILLFKDQVVTTYMGTAGDSGSILLNYCDNVVGLLFAYSNYTTTFNKIENVLSALKVDVVTCNNYLGV